MKSPCLPIALAALVCHRFALMSLSHFRVDLAQHALENLACGLTSDLSFAALLVAVSGFVGPWSGRWRLGRVVAPLLTAGWLLLLAAHVRYVDYFGFTIRPVHLGKLFAGEALRAGAVNVAREPLTLALLFVPVVVGTLFFWRYKGRGPGMRAGFAALVVAGASHGVVNHFKEKQLLNRELRFSPLAALYFNWAEQARFGAKRVPDEAELREARTLLHGARIYADDPSYPLWQRQLPELPPSNGTAPFQMLKDYLRRESDRLGPWNVVLILSESLRAAEAYERPDLFSRLPAWFARGVRFTETYSAGLHTSHGQVAALCSVYNPGSMDLMFRTPRSRVTCLADVLKNAGRSTHFYYGGDNAFDSQNVFHPSHGFDEVLGQEAFPPDAPKAGWGISDHAVFELAAARLARQKPPFFATILSLSNHQPFEIAADAAPGVASPGLSIDDQILQYVDWSLDALLARLARELPHTIVILTADHGNFRGESVGNHAWSFASFRSVTRVPFLILVPDAPAGLPGLSLAHPTSTADVAPTIMALLGLDAPNQFMGANAFDATRTRALVNWQNSLYFVDPKARPEVVPVAKTVEEVYAALHFGDLLAPRR